MLERVVDCASDVFPAYQRYISKRADAIVATRWKWVENLAAALIEQRRLRGAFQITNAAFGERLAAAFGERRPGSS